MTTGSVAVPLDAYFQSRCDEVNSALERWLPAESAEPASLSRAMRYAVFPGGKRLRPILVLAACDACGGSEADAIPAACAVEMVHCYSLVHDDLPAMDDDDVRRGRPTCHREFGEAIAILAGDALLTLAFELLASHCAPPALAATACRELAAAAGARGMVGGQADDVHPAAHHGSRSAMEQLQHIHARKTGALLSACVRLGGIAARADDSAMAMLNRFGKGIGLAFQIADDLLDACGEQCATGKRVGKDKDRGKLTYPGLIGVEPSRRLAAELMGEACEAIRPLGRRATRLEQLARFIVERDR